MADPLFWDEEGRLPQTLWWDSWVFSTILIVIHLSFLRRQEERLGPWWRRRLWRGHDRLSGRRQGQRQGRLGAQDLQVCPSDASQPSQDGEGRCNTLLIMFVIDDSSALRMAKISYYQFDDVSNMTYLNEAAVLWNLKSRYVSKLIYTYSGLL